MRWGTVREPPVWFVPSQGGSHGLHGKKAFTKVFLYAKNVCPFKAPKTAPKRKRMWDVDAYMPKDKVVNIAYESGDVSISWRLSRASSQDGDSAEVVLINKAVITGKVLDANKMSDYIWHEIVKLMGDGVQRLFR